MLNMGLQTYFWTVLLMIRAPIGLYELNICSSILTRRGGIDANAPGILRAAILRDLGKNVNMQISQDSLREGFGSVRIQSASPS